MGKYSLTKRRHSHQPKSLQVQPETTAFGNVEQSNSSIRSKQQQQSQRRSTFFQPLAASTPYHIERSNAFSDGSPHTLLLTPPVCYSTPKQTRRTITTTNNINNSHGRVSATLQYNPSVPTISQRRLQFTSDLRSFVRYSTDESKRMHIKNIRIWLL